MSNISIIINFILILSLFNSYFADSCRNISESDYLTIEFNTPFKLDLKPQEEICLKYELPSIKNFIGLSFIKGNSYTVEVIVYNSYLTLKEDSIDLIHILLERTIIKNLMLSVSMRTCI